MKGRPAESTKDMGIQKTSPLLRREMLRNNHQKSPQNTKLGLVLPKVRETDQGFPQNELRLESVIKLLKQIISIYASISLYRHIYIHIHILMGLPRWH